MADGDESATDPNTSGPMAIERGDGDRPVAMAYAMALEERERVLRNLRIPATGFALFAGLKIASTLTGAGTVSSIVFCMSLIAFLIAWAINHTPDTLTSFVRQLFFIVPRLATIGFEVWLLVTAAQDNVKRIARLAELPIAIAANVTNIALIIKAKAIDRQRSETAYVRWTLASHFVFSLHALIIGLLGIDTTPPANAGKISNSWFAALIAGTVMSHVLQYIIYQPQIVNSLLISVAKQSKFYYAIAGVYVSLLTWIIKGSINWTDLPDTIKNYVPPGGK